MNCSISNMKAHEINQNLKEISEFCSLNSNNCNFTRKIMDFWASMDFEWNSILSFTIYSPLVKIHSNFPCSVCHMILKWHRYVYTFILLIALIVVATKNWTNLIIHPSFFHAAKNFQIFFRFFFFFGKNVRNITKKIQNGKIQPSKLKRK